MISDDIIAFLKGAVATPENKWLATALGEIARLHVPDVVLGRRAHLLRADLNMLWAQWFVESICDPEVFVESENGYAFIVRAVMSRLNELVQGAPEAESKDLVRYLAQTVAHEVDRRKQKRRVVLDRDIKGIILDRCGSQPRCWICGYAFTDWAVDRFLGSERRTPPALPAFVDLAKPSGLLVRDLTIEIDHVLPVNQGGREGPNLRIACGWCNNHKSDRCSLYDVHGLPLIVWHPRRGKLSAPRPFWVVRVLGIRQQCEWPGVGGCSRTTETTELTVCAWNGAGAMNPTNLRVTCWEHHPLEHERLVSRDLVLAGDAGLKRNR